MKLIPLIVDGDKKTRNGYNLLQKNIFKGAMLSGVQQLVIVTHRDFFSKTQEELHFLDKSMSFILGTVPKNSAAVIAASAAHISQLHGEDALILVLAMNDLTIDQKVFQRTISMAVQTALAGNLVTFGMQPHAANTKYSAPSERCALQEPLTMHRLLWNSNLFLFGAGTILQTIKTHRPDVLSATLDCLKGVALTEEKGSLVLELNSAHFATIPKCALNEGIVKKSSKTIMMPCDLEWLERGVSAKNT